MTAQRFWRFNVNSITSGNDVDFDTITMSAAGGPNLATNVANVSASSFYNSTYSPDRAITGVSGFWGSSTVAPQWWQYDIGAGLSASIDTITITAAPGYPTRAPASFTVQSSSDNIAFVNEWSGTFSSWSEGQTQSTTNPAYAAAGGAVIIISRNFAMLMT